MKFPKLIVLTGKRESGKDTVGKIIQELEIEWEKIQFAQSDAFLSSGRVLGFYNFKSKYTLVGTGDMCREIVQVLTGLTPDQLIKHEVKAKKSLVFRNSTYGDLQIAAGNFIRTLTDASVLELMYPKFGKEAHIVTGCRFPNEVEFGEDQDDCLVIRVEGDPNKVRGNGERDDNDITETALDEYPFKNVIVNDGTLEELKQKVINLLSE